MILKVRVQAAIRLVEFGLPSVITYSQRNIEVPRRFLQDSSSLKNMIRSTPLNHLLPSHRFQIRNTVYSGVYGHQASIFRALEARGKHSFLPALWFQKIKTSSRLFSYTLLL